MPVEVVVLVKLNTQPWLVLLRMVLLVDDVVRLVVVVVVTIWGCFSGMKA